jgi:hypothetical protein
MKLHNGSTSFFIPDGKPEGEALSRVTHLGIGAHQDDLEFTAFSTVSHATTNGSGASPAPTAPAVRAVAHTRRSPTRA